MHSSAWAVMLVKISPRAGTFPTLFWRMIDTLASFALVSFDRICLCHHKYRRIRGLYSCVNTDPESRTAMRGTASHRYSWYANMSRSARAACKDPSWNGQFHVSQEPARAGRSGEFIAVSLSRLSWRSYLDCHRIDATLPAPCWQEWVARHVQDADSRPKTRNLLHTKLS